MNSTFSFADNCAGAVIFEDTVHYELAQTKKKNEVMFLSDFLRSFMKVFIGIKKKKQPKKFFLGVRNFFFSPSDFRFT